MKKNKTSKLNKSKKTTKKQTLCWKCRNAVPNATCGCSWSKSFIPVKGWTAEKVKIVTQKETGHCESYCVTDCPKFEKDRSGENHCKDNNACVRVAELILRGQISRYRTALGRYARTGDKNDLAQVRSIERELLTPYYSALTMHNVDFREVCNDLRKREYLPELERGKNDN